MGGNYELVKPGCINSASTGGGIVQHANFRAKSKGIAAAPMEMFFVQTRYTKRNSKGCWIDLVVDCCKSLGPADKLPRLIHHPKKRVQRMLTGCDNDDLSWLGISDDADSMAS